jgi:hypothetical protein
MRRATLEKHRTIQTWRPHLATHGLTLICECELQSGRFRKSQRVGGCGRPRCYLCHFAKLTDQPTVRDMRYLASRREGLAETEAARRATSREGPAAD